MTEYKRKNKPGVNCPSSENSRYRKCDRSQGDCPVLKYEDKAAVSNKVT